MGAIIVHDGVGVLKEGVQPVPDGGVGGRRAGEGVRQREEGEQDVVGDVEEAFGRWRSAG